MHAHGTAVLPDPTAATRPTLPDATSRDRWLADCEFFLAKALATRNPELLPVTAAAWFLPWRLRCPDCYGTGYTSYDNIIEPCTCTGGDRPAYDFRRHAKGGVVASITTSPRTPSGQAEVWVPCTCGIGPVKIGPFDGDKPTRVPWYPPSCTLCSDTGWKFSHLISQAEIYTW